MDSKGDQWGEFLFSAMAGAATTPFGATVMLFIPPVAPLIMFMALLLLARLVNTNPSPRPGPAHNPWSTHGPHPVL